MNSWRVLTPLNLVYHCPHPFRWAYFSPSLHTMQQRTIMHLSPYYNLWSYQKMSQWKTYSKSETNYEEYSMLQRKTIFHSSSARRSLKSFVVVDDLLLLVGVETWVKIPQKNWTFTALLAEVCVHEISEIQSLSTKLVEFRACPLNLWKSMQCV